MHEKRFQKATTFALVFAMLLSLLPMAVPKASAASSSTLANVTETYVDASDGSEVSKAETYSVTHEERSPQKIADYTYQDYSESVERVYSHKDLNYIYGYPDKTVRPDRPMSRGEAAAVFYRLYDGSYPDAKRGMSENTFSDIDKKPLVLQGDRDAVQHRQHQWLWRRYLASQRSCHPCGVCRLGGALVWAGL